MDALIAALKSKLTACRQAGYFPDAVLQAADKDKVLFTLTVGDAAENTWFDLASVTKTFTSTLTLDAIKSGLFRLDAPILSLLPQGADPLLRSRLDGITVFQLLTHTSTLPAWYPFYAADTPFYDTLLAAVQARYERGVVYSDLNFILLGKMLENVYSLPLNTLMEQKLLAPSGMEAGYLPPQTLPLAPSSYGNPIEETMVRDLGLTYAHFRPHTPLVGQVNDGNAHYAFHGVSGHAGLFGCARAVTKLGQRYLNAQALLDIQSLTEQAPGRGLGWQISDALFPMGAGHTGFTGVSIWIAPPLQITCALLTNRLFYPHDNPNKTNDVRADIHRAIAQAFCA